MSQSAKKDPSLGEPHSVKLDESNLLSWQITPRTPFASCGTSCKFSHAAWTCSSAFPYYPRRIALDSHVNTQAQTHEACSTLIIL